MDDLALARALHVLGVVIWFGGVSMATTVALPAVERGELGEDRLNAFEAFERRFVWQARAAVIVVGLSGFYMTAKLDLWSRFATLEAWWMSAMVGVWSLFVFLLFIGEPFVLHRYFPRWAQQYPRLAFSALRGVHVVLLSLGLITTLGAVAGSHGWLFTASR